jgi:hypothetical protein
MHGATHRIVTVVEGIEERADEMIPVPVVARRSLVLPCCVLPHASGYPLLLLPVTVGRADAEPTGQGIHVKVTVAFD